MGEWSSDRPKTFSIYFASVRDPLESRSPRVFGKGEANSHGDAKCGSSIREQHQHRSAAGCCAPSEPAAARFAGAQRRPKISKRTETRRDGRRRPPIWHSVDIGQHTSRLEHRARPTTRGGGLAPPTTDDRNTQTRCRPRRARSPRSDGSPPSRHHAPPRRRSPPRSPAPTRSRATSPRATASRTPPCA